LHHGRRNGDGVSRGAPFLVAEDHRAPVSGVDRKGCCADDFRGIQPYLLPAIYSRISRDAAALSCLCSGISGAQRDVHRGRIDSRRRVSVASGVFALVVALRPGGRPESLAGDWAGMDNTVTATEG